MTAHLQPRFVDGKPMACTLFCACGGRTLCMVFQKTQSAHCRYCARVFVVTGVMRAECQDFRDYRKRDYAKPEGP